MLPDSGGKVKKMKNVFPFNNLALLNLDFAKNKIAKKGKKGKKTNYGSHPLISTCIESSQYFLRNDRDCKVVDSYNRLPQD